MLFLCDNFDTISCEILNKNQLICPKIHYYSIFIHYLASVLKFCTIVAQLCHLKAIVSRNKRKIVKISMFVSMATMKATLVLGLLQFVILEGYCFPVYYIYVICIPVEVII